MVSDLNFDNNKFIGDGSQKYRAVSIFFQKDEVHWFMDSQLEKNYQFTYNRKNGKIQKRNIFNGPVWYSKSLEDGYFLIATTVEKGKGVIEKSANLLISNDLKNWTVLKKFKKDIFPMPIFKWGVISFSSGKQYLNSFRIYFEGLKKYDGKVYDFSVINNFSKK